MLNSSWTDRKNPRTVFLAQTVSNVNWDGWFLHAPATYAFLYSTILEHYQLNDKYQYDNFCFCLILGYSKIESSFLWHENTVCYTKNWNIVWLLTCSCVKPKDGRTLFGEGGPRPRDPIEATDGRPLPIKFEPDKIPTPSPMLPRIILSLTSNI